MLRGIYLGLAIIGAVKPMLYYVPWFRENGLDFAAMMNAAYANAITTGLAWEVLIAAVALIVWILVEVYVRKDYWVAAICIAVISVVGLACGLPLYLYLRTRPLK